ncbi:MAG: phosphoserine phosphatase SerB [Novosphingobium sp.]
MLIARLIAEVDALSANLEHALADLAAQGMTADVSELAAPGGVQLSVIGGDAAKLAAVLDARFAPSDMLIADHVPTVPQIFVSDMDSTMIAAECIDELADFAGLKPQIAEITERAMQGELDFKAALLERVALLRGLNESAIRECLDTRITAMPGAKVLVATLKSKGCKTVLVTGGFHQFADPVAEELGFEMVVGNRLEIADGALTGGLTGPIVDSSVKQRVLEEQSALAGAGAISLATGDGANDIPMLQVATYGLAYQAKPKARAAADGWVDRGDLTGVLDLLGIAREEWVWE